ncbi:MAG: SMP-30/gluconolactonase/LRE family protein [Planctomycetota bacterium]
MKRMQPSAAASILLLCATVFGGTTGVYAQAEVIGFDSDRWVIENARIVEHLGRQCLVGTAILDDVEFQNGVIEVDIAVDGSRSYPGILFRMQSKDSYEKFYLRPHRAGLYPDALQYAPTFNGASCWQLYTGDGFTASARIPENQWLHVKMEIHGTQARVYLGDAEGPALLIHDLRHGLSKGAIGVSEPTNGVAYFSNFQYRHDDTLEFAAPPPPESPPRMIRGWEVSRPFPAAQVDTENYPGFFTIFNAGWRRVEAEPSGLVNLSKLFKHEAVGGDCVFARTVVRSDRRRTAKLSFGYSDNIDIFLNGKKVFSGRSAYRSRDPSFVGTVGLNDAAYMTLEKGINDIFLMVSDSFGGWGFMGRTNVSLKPPLRQDGILKKVWETPADFKIPESVLYDPERDILYVSSFDKIQASNVETGFISKVKLDGEIESLHWVTGLDGPCGMCIRGDRLFVVEGFRANIVEINLDDGKVVNRSPVQGATFLNDIAADPAGNIYVSDTSRSPRANDIYRFRDGKIELWKEGDEIHRANGLFAHDGSLIVGNTGDGMLKAVNLADGRVDSIACLGAGVIDGIRVDADGNYLVSHWEGQVYVISPDGRVVQILDTMADRQNVADFEYVKDRRLLIVPTFLGNKVAAYQYQGLDG